jgi:hypothetical protein
VTRPLLHRGLGIPVPVRRLFRKLLERGRRNHPSKVVKKENPD